METGCELTHPALAIHPAFTMKQYAHVIPGMQAEAAELVAALVANPRPITG